MTISRVASNEIMSNAAPATGISSSGRRSPAEEARAAEEGGAADMELVLGIPISVMGQRMYSLSPE